MLSFPYMVILNIITESVLALILLIIVLNMVTDKPWKEKKSEKYFFYVAVFDFAYVLFSVSFWCLFGYPEYSVFSNAAISSCYLISVLIYSSLGLWIASIIEEKQPLEKIRKFFIRFGMIPVAIINLLNFFINHSEPSEYYVNPQENIYSLCMITAWWGYNLFLLIVTVVFSGKLGKLNSFLFACLLIIPSVLEMQTFWQYTPTDIAMTLFVFIAYIGIWKRRREKSLKNDSELAKNKSELAKSRIEIMESQISPHFIYNSLNSIAALCRLNPQKAKEITEDFSEYLHGNFDSAQKATTVPFSDELKHIKAYLNIEKTRFEDKLNIEYDIETENFELPALSIQPLVENAVKHGAMKNPNGGTVRLLTREDTEGYYISVEDDGMGFKVSSLDLSDNKHIGLNNAKERLSALCNGELNITSQIGVGTVASVFIPKKF